MKASSKSAKKGNMVEESKSIVRGKVKKNGRKTKNHNELELKEITQGNKVVRQSLYRKFCKKVQS
jgi:hypothetical protein